MVLKPALRQLLILLCYPGAFFEKHPPRESIGGATGVVVLVALFTTAALAVIGWLFTSNIDATTTRTIMEPWPDSACEIHNDSDALSEPEPCQIDEPVTEEVAIGSLIWEGFLRQLPVVFVSVFAMWFLVAGSLHVLSTLGDGTGSFTGTLSVVGWAMIPQVVQLITGAATVFFIVRGLDFSSDPDVLRHQLEQFASLAPGAFGTVVAVVVVLWQAYIWTHGLRVARDIRLDAAAIISGLVALAMIVFSVA